MSHGSTDVEGRETGVIWFLRTFWVRATYVTEDEVVRPDFALNLQFLSPRQIPPMMVDNYEDTFPPYFIHSHSKESVTLSESPGERAAQD
ncbi:hypothetical protein CVT26_009891 [Gymnopilus dilepis]|uniref:Uncharacterized protein n=1 Tax=Gymnopilus dilepis TaxID=231916 RepID=A0A409YC34_9AGAR|nr:hypothetical protein CVT26_009891 [Gymnopilus dilepis]